MRGATGAYAFIEPILKFQSTRPVRGATPPRYYDKLYDVISIHAPRAGRDLVRYYGPDYDNLFQSTRPVRGATGVAQANSAFNAISIHAPRAGRDKC